MYFYDDENVSPLSYGAMNFPLINAGNKRVRRNSKR